jgi:surfactin synthase thioesterase subunit
MPSSARINPWLRRFHPAPEAPMRLVYFPHAGGAANSSFQLSAALPPVAEVVSVQYPGRHDRFGEPCVDSLGTLADEVTPWLDALDDKPMAFFGHSMGSILAFEVARRLRAEQGDVGGGAASAPTHLFVSGRRAPTIFREERVHLMDDGGLVDDLRALQGTDDSIFDDPDVMQLVLPAVRADYRAIETYVYEPGPPLACPVTAVIGDSDPRVDRADAEAWRQQTTGEFRLHVFPGGHFYLGEGALGVVDLLRGALAERVY